MEAQAHVPSHERGAGSVDQIFKPAEIHKQVQGRNHHDEAEPDHTPGSRSVQEGQGDPGEHQQQADEIY